MDFLGQTSLLAAVTSFAVGFSVLARNVRNKLFISFALLTTLVSAWALFFFLERIWEGGLFYRFHLLFNAWIAAAGVAFIHVFVRNQDTFSRRLLDLTIFLNLILTVALGLRMDIANPWILQVIYYTPALIILQILRLMWLDRGLRKEIKRHPKLSPAGTVRRNMIYFGGLLVLSTSVMDHAPWLGVVVPSFGNLFLTVYLFFLSQAISQQRLLNFSGLVSRFIVLLLVALTLTGIYSLLMVWIENSPGLFFLNSFIVSFLLLMLLDPLRALVTYSTRRLLSQKHRRLEQTLREAQRKLAGIVDPGILFQAILLTTEQTLNPEWVALFVLRSDGTKYRRVRTAGHEPKGGSSLKEMIANHPLLQFCERLQKKGELAILLDQVIENEIDRSASRAQRDAHRSLLEGFRALDCNLLIPLFDGEKILGFITVKALEPPEPWGGNWGLLPMVYPYFEQVARTMRNMEVYVKQREKERLAALGEMAAGLAHEIRNPLGAIKGAAQFLDPSTDKPESKFLRVIIEEVDRLNRVVTQFLDYSKPPTTDFKSVDLSELVQKTIEMMRPTLKSSVRLEFHPPKKRAHVMASPEQIQQVLLNLFQNSVKALEGKADGSIRVGIDTDGEDSGAEVTLTVEDSGHGIKREHLDKLFIPFFTTSPSGTGLGLSISHKIIEAHRGRIEVASEEGRFTRFSVILPYVKET